MAKKMIHGSDFFYDVDSLQELADTHKEDIMMIVNGPDGKPYELVLRVWNGSRKEVSDQNNRDDSTIRGFHLEGSVRDSNGFGHTFPFDIHYKQRIRISHDRMTNQLRFSTT